MKAGWEVKALGDVIDLISGQHIDAKDYNTEGQGIGYLTGPSDFGSICPTVSKWTEFPKKNAKSGDVLLTVKGSGVGKVNLLDIPEVAISRQIMAVRAKTIDPRFLFLLLQSFQNYFNGRASGAAIPGISRTDVTGLRLPLPPLEEQKRIVEVLDAAFEGLTRARAHTETNLQNARELFESGLLEVFGGLNDPDDQKLLSDVSLQFGRGKSKHRPRNDKALYGGTYPFIQTGDVRNSRHIIESYSQTYNDVGLAQSKLWPSGTVCITIAANIAETGVLGFDACFPDSIIGMVPNATKTSSTYVEYLLQFFQKRIKALGEGSAQQNINLATFETEYFPFPPLHVQDDAVERLSYLRSTVQDLETHYRAKLADLDDIRQALLQKAFAGELT
ncbi:restriction endonuclease subunit S [Pseudorhodobacter wandonensis]|uniref:restriction endonuclease subunit S n=1 Tax=Pseudorhodobacter wandonensis TaxID=1120568 RepID=UPI00067D45F1|nr:restriction endonuclease subunit S [Pseudorhodobacter wandonensis]